MQTRGRQDTAFCDWETSRESYGLRYDTYLNLLLLFSKNVANVALSLNRVLIRILHGLDLLFATFKTHVLL